jgi:hypothetical protein
VPIVRSLEDLNRYGGFSVPCIVIVCPLEGKPEVQVIASTPEERQSLRLDLRHDDGKALLVALGMLLAGLGGDDDEADE